MSGKFLVPCLLRLSVYSSAALGDSQNRELSSTHTHHKMTNRSLRSCGWREKVVRSQNNIFLKMGKSKKEIKFLVLGPAKSGKTTFIKQLEVPHNYRHGISSFQYLEKYRPYIYKNIFKAIQTLIQGMEQFQIEYESPESRQRASRFHTFDLSRQRGRDPSRRH